MNTYKSILPASKHRLYECADAAREDHVAEQHGAHVHGFRNVDGTDNGRHDAGCGQVGAKEHQVMLQHEVWVCDDEVGSVEFIHLFTIRSGVCTILFFNFFVNV